MKTNLDIYGVKIVINSDKKIAGWLRHDYGSYIVDDIAHPRLQFNLILENYDITKLPELTAKIYHDDYIVYDLYDLRIIDFLGNGISLYRHREKQTNIYCPDYDKLYEIFYLSFESLIGEELDGQGLHRIHCLALEKHGRATILLLPPGAGKTTLALKFLGNDNIKVLTEDILLYKKNCLYGLHFRWGTNDESFMDSGRIMKREKYKSKILLDASRLSLSRTAKPKNIILGQRTTSEKSEIIRISKIKLFFALFKSMVLGLELQQSLAYFLLRNHRDAFLKSKIGFKRLCAMSRLLCKSKGYVFYMGFNIEKNYNTLSEFVKQTN